MLKILTKYIFIILLAFGCGSCIHEYPTGAGSDPSAIDLGIELTIDLKWGESITQPFFPTKGRNESDMRVVIEISRNGEIVGRDMFFLSDEEYANGYTRRRLPFTLHALSYEVAVWCDRVDSSSKTEHFDVSDLSSIKNNSISGWSSEDACGYAMDTFDLREYRGKWDVKLIKEMTLSHAGARFRLITTDIRKFVEEQLWEIEKGETYTVTINFENDTADSFNAFTGAAIRNYSYPAAITVPLKPTYDIYGELEIAEGFVFCDSDDMLSMNVTVHNSARMPVVKSPEFRFEVHRGMISIVSGEFLSEIFSGNIKINNIWEGEITVDL